MKKIYNSPKIFIHKLYCSNILQNSNVDVIFNTSINKEYKNSDDFYEIEF